MCKIKNVGLLISFVSMIVSACSNSGNNNGLRSFDEPCDENYKCAQGLFCEAGLCRKICNNDDDCNGRQDCIAGVCKSRNDCRPNLKGANCDECAGGYYGPKCVSCPSCGGGTCEDGKEGSGACLCDEQHVGNNCQYEITCKHGTMDQNGKCSSCDAHWDGENCDHCADGWAGENCDMCDVNHYGPDCRPCECVHGQCEEGLTGRGCQCDNAWSGEKCEDCTNPRAYGENCAICTRPMGVYDQASDADCQLIDARDEIPDVYQVVDIDGRLWLGENLKYNGAPHLSVDGNSEYDNDYGLLYSPEVAYGICPDGWRLPSGDELKAVNDAAGCIDSNEGENCFGLLKDGMWDYYSDTSSDSVGFGLVPSGDFFEGKYSGFGGGLALLTYEFNNDGLGYTTYNVVAYIFASCIYAEMYSHQFPYLSVRCIKSTCPGHKIGDKCDSCYIGWTGPDCQYPITCEHGTVAQDGTCSGDCDPGWTGKNCELKITCEQGEYSSTTGKCKPGSCYPGWDEDDGGNCNHGTFTDSRTQITYKKVSIGKKIWMAQELIYTSNSFNYKNPKVANNPNYGTLYQWATATGNEICPADWRLPTASEIDALINFVEKNKSGYSSALALMAKSDDWTNYPSMGTDEFGFSAYPSGSFSGSNYYGNGTKSTFWSSERRNSTPNDMGAFAFEMYDSGNINKILHIDDYHPVRCVQ